MAARNYYKKSKNQLILCHLHVFIIMNTKILLFANVLALASKPLTLILSNSHQTRHYFEKLSTSTPFWQRTQEPILNILQITASTILLHWCKNLV